MSEEEIINVLSNLFFDEYEWFLRGYDTQTKEEDKETIEQAIQGLLDLYQKEKQKNKELENADLTTVYMNGFYDGEKKWKDKIKQRAIEYEHNNDGYDCTTADYKESQNIGRYLAYLELLEERN